MKIPCSLIVVCYIFICSCKTAGTSEDDNAFINKNLRGFPNEKFYRQRSWQLVSGYNVDDMLRMNLSYVNGDTIMECRLERDGQNDSAAYVRELNVMISFAEKRQRLKIVNETDTVYDFFVPKDFQFSNERSDTAFYTFVSGKYNYLFENLYYDSCQQDFYISKRDSLEKIKGDSLARLPGCKE